MPTNGQFVTGEVLTAASTNSLLTRGYQNRIINGAFVINQRAYTSGTNLASGSYGFDRWKSGYTNTSLTFTAGSQSTTVTISASGVIQQIIERENVPAGDYTLSWAGTATARVYNSGGTPPAYAASPVLVTLDGAANVVVEFTASGGTKTLGTVQLEAGTVFSPFEYRLRGDELAICQRYYQRITTTTGDNAFASGVFLSTTQPLGSFVFPVMRTSPTFSFNGTFDVVTAGVAPAVTGLSAGNITPSTAQFGGTTSGAVNGGGCVYRMDSGYFDLSAEL